MREHRPSFTAAFVATCRGLGPLLPERLRLVDDPLGARFAGGPLGDLAAALRDAGPVARGVAAAGLAPLVPWVLYMQVRTRAIDDALVEAVEAGCRQVVILGAGFDARASRMRAALRDAAVYEVDHPATQRRKRAVIDAAGAPSIARYLAWDFERDPMSELPARLAAMGHDPAAPTFTIWEGVTMYLSAEALDATARAVAGYSAPGSRLAFNYVRRDLVDAPGPLTAVVSRFVKGVGEPFRSGFDPSSLPDWLEARGFGIVRDNDFADLAARMLPSPWSRVTRVGRRFAVAERTAVAERVAPTA